MDSPPLVNRDGKEEDAAKDSEDTAHDVAQGRNPPGGGNQLLGDLLSFVFWVFLFDFCLFDTSTALG